MEIWQSLKAAEQAEQLAEYGRLNFWIGFFVGSPLGAVLVFFMARGHHGH